MPIPILDRGLSFVPDLYDYVEARSPSEKQVKYTTKIRYLNPIKRIWPKYLILKSLLLQVVY